MGIGYARISLLTLTSILSVTAQGEQWTAAQKEVLEAERACAEANTVEAVMACFHEDFEGWGVDSPVPTNTADRRAYFTRAYAKENGRRRSSNRSQSMYTATRRRCFTWSRTRARQDTGKETTATEKWLDVLQKRGNKWAWIADYGTQLSSDEE